VEIPRDLPFVALDFVLIVHVLVNVIDNALKYSPPGAPLTLRRAPPPQRWKSGCWIGDRYPVGDLERIFDKFYRVQRPDNVSGTGLGLAISKGIVEAHGGRIYAENRPDGGAVIVLCLPRESTQD
jgi:two-component system sensor histidine kinase KdpD